tara:strand:+ start:37512 stop:37739 length:228 start_codon:yes stop_codon:yes gene_type:complete
MKKQHLITLAVLTAAQPALAGQSLGRPLGTELGNVLGSALSAPLGGALPAEFGGVAAIAAIGLVLGIQLVRRKKK